MKHLSQEQIQEILDTYERTKIVRVTADLLGLKTQRVRYWLKKHQASFPGFRATACYRNYDLVVALAKRGVSYSEIARRVGTNHHRVKDFLSRYEIDHPGHNQSGRNNSNWRGGRLIDKDGYVLVHLPDHPRCNRHGYMREHRLVMEKALGRYLDSSEVVHHIDDDHQNNVLENLKLYSSNGRHLADTLAGQVPNWSENGLERMQAGIRRSARRRRNASLSRSKPGVSGLPETKSHSEL